MPVCVRHPLNPQLCRKKKTHGQSEAELGTSTASRHTCTLLDTACGSKGLYEGDEGECVITHTQSIESLSTPLQPNLAHEGVNKYLTPNPSPNPEPQASPTQPSSAPGRSLQIPRKLNAAGRSNSTERLRMLRTKLPSDSWNLRFRGTVGLGSWPEDRNM